MSERLTGCPCCGSNEMCDCDLDYFYLRLDNQRAMEEIELLESKLHKSNRNIVELISFSSYIGNKNVVKFS